MFYLRETAEIDNYRNLCYDLNTIQKHHKSHNRIRFDLNKNISAEMNRVN